MSDTSSADSIASEASVTDDVPNPVRQLVFHGVFLFLQVLSWISTCVAFAGILFSGSIKSLNYDAYYDHVETTIRSMSYDELPFSNSCTHAGKGYVATQAIAFVLIVITVSLTILRAIGKAESVPFIRTNTKSVNAEIICTLLSTLFFFISILILGGACYQSFQSADNVTVRPVGFVFTIICFFLLIFTIPILYFIRKETVDETFQNVGATNQTGQAYVTSDTGGYSTGGEAASYGSYQSV